MSQMRGTSVLGTLQYVREVHGEEALRRVLEALPAATRQVVDGPVPVLPDGWYDIALVADLTRVVDRVCGKGDLALARAVGRHVAFADVNRFFKWLLRLTGPGLLFSRAASIWNNYYRDGTYVFEGTEGQAASIRIEAWPGCDAVICRRIEGWIERACELTLGPDARPTIHEEVHLGTDEAVSPHRFCRFRARWGG